MTVSTELFLVDFDTCHAAFLLEVVEVLGLELGFASGSDSSAGILNYGISFQHKHLMPAGGFELGALRKKRQFKLT